VLLVQHEAFDVSHLHSRILDLVGEVSGLLDLDMFRAGLLVALRAALPSDYISLNEVSANPGQNWSIVEPPLSADQHDTYYSLAVQNPLAAHFLRTRDGRPLRLSDIVTPGQFHATDLYQEFYAPLQVEHQIAFALPSDDRHILAIALSRCDHDYTDAERDLLTIARPHLIQAYRNALDYTNQRTLTTEILPPGPHEQALTALGLTPAQARVLRLIALGRSTPDIANDLQIAQRTVQKHLQRIYQKLGVTSRSAAAAQAWQTTTSREQPADSHASRSGQRS
jgi:DNA-binding CsgD family transcriptional regulator